MAERKNIALLFSYNEAWIGGTYYIISLINALNDLPDEEKPNIIVVCKTDDDFDVAKATHYPFLSMHAIDKLDMQLSISLIERIVNKISYRLSGKIFLQKKMHFNHSKVIDAVFPCPQMNVFVDVKKSLFWIPDFQDYYFPEYFINNKDEKEWRYKLGYYIAYQKKKLVLSSQDTLNSFNKIYPANNAEVHVLPFAVSHPEFKHLDIETLKEKFAINFPYFFSPNQFWKHKNHIVIIEAVRILKEKGYDKFQIIFSGKEIDFRNPNYIIDLKNLVKKYQLERQILFLGFIDRKEQLQLMNHAVSIIQPSLFEGWSTVVEDAKALNQNIIASDIAVHIEQLQSYQNTLFSKSDANDLANKMIPFLTQSISRPQYNYKNDRLIFARKFMRSI